MAAAADLARKLSLVCACLGAPMALFAFIAAGTSSGGASGVRAAWLQSGAFFVLCAYGVVRFWGPKPFNAADWGLAAAILSPVLLAVAWLLHNLASHLR